MNQKLDEDGEKNEDYESIHSEGDMHWGHWTYECTGAFSGGHFGRTSTNVENLGDMENSVL